MNVSIVGSYVPKEVSVVISSLSKESMFSMLYVTILIRVTARNVTVIALEIVDALFSLRLVLTK